jgi:hypothetical protein
VGEQETGLDGLGPGASRKGGLWDSAQGREELGGDLGALTSSGWLHY